MPTPSTQVFKKQNNFKRQNTCFFVLLLFELSSLNDADFLMLFLFSTGEEENVG
jgi:hypothetical protein